MSWQPHANLVSITVQRTVGEYLITVRAKPKDYITLQRHIESSRTSPFQLRFVLCLHYIQHKSHRFIILRACQHAQRALLSGASSHQAVHPTPPQIPATLPTSLRNTHPPHPTNPHAPHQKHPQQIRPMVLAQNRRPGLTYRHQAPTQRQRRAEDTQILDGNGQEVRQ